MVNYDETNSSQFFQDQLEIKLLKLSALWGKSPKSAAAITEIRAAAKQRILSPTDERLKRINNGTAFGKYSRFFETQLTKEYHPILFIQGVQPRSAMQKQAVEFLQDFARDVSKAVLAEQAQKSKINTVEKAPPKTDISQTTYDSMIVKIRELKSKIELGVAHATIKKLEEFQEKRMKPKLDSLQQEIAALEKSDDQPRLLNIKEKHFQMLQAQSQKIGKQLNQVPVLTDAVEPTMSSFAKAVLFGQSQRDPAAAKFIEALKQSPAPKDATIVEEVPTPPSKLSERDLSKAKIAKWKDVPALSEQRAVVTAEKPKASIFKSLMATAAVTAALVGSVMAGLAGGTLYREAQRDTAQDNARLVSAQADFNESAAIYNSRPLTEFFTEPAAQGAKVKTVDKNIHKTVKVDDSPKFAAELQHKHRADYKVMKDTDIQPVKHEKTISAKAKADFRPAAAANDANMTYEPTVMKAFDPLSMRADLTTLVNACKQAGVSGANTVCGSITAPTVN